MVILREMRQREYPAYCEYFIDDYSREIAQNYGHSIEDAIELAKIDLQESFPNGLESEKHSLLCIETSVNGNHLVIGYLWHSVSTPDHSTFIYDFYVSDEHRGQGFGKQALIQLEEQLKPVGINQIKLRVAYRNERAFKLYKEVGFTITGFNMSKKLDN